MSAPANDWGAAYRHYDDAALAALASVGLLRRAARDLDAGKVGWHADGGAAQGVVAADGQRVQLAPDGPAATRCDCPAPGVCKHVLAAALWLRQDVAPTDVLAEVLALDPAALCKAVGIGATRKAAAMYATLDDAGAEVQGAVLVITLPGLDLACRYVAGAGFGGMVSEAAPGARNSVHLLALAAFWRLHGRAFPWPEAALPPPAPEQKTALDDDERRFLRAVRALVLDLCAGGWSHIGATAAPRLRALATSARVDAMPRLAGLLRALAGSAALLARRDFGADERQALRLAAHIHALVAALEQAGPDVLAQLRGSERRAFAPGATLDLMALGAHWWQQRSGARGLTLAFWDAQANVIRQAVLARRDRSDPQFTRHGAWSEGELWPGAGTPQTLAGHALLLEHPRLADDGRLGLGDASRARLEPAWRADDARWLRAGFDDWESLRAAAAGAAGLMGEPLDLVLLRPAAVKQPLWDEARQELRWRVEDRRGATLLLRMPYAGWKAARMDALEAWCASDAIIGIVARVELLEPVMLVVERKGRLHPVSLDFDGAAAPLDSDPAPPATPVPMPVPTGARRAHARVLDAMLAQLERKAMSGHLHLVAPDDVLRSLQAPLLALGLDTPAALLARYLAAPDSARALMLYHVGQLCLELDGGSLRD